MRNPRGIFLLAGFLALLSLVSCSSSSSAPAQTYNLGDKVPLGRLSYTVYEGQWLPQLGDGTGARIPQHRFFELRMSVTNESAAEMMAPNAVLVDDTSGEVGELANGDRVDSWLGYVRRVKAGETLTGHILFDAPPKHYRLRLSEDGTADRAVYVDVPLSFSDASPAVPASDLARKQ